ncbi:hypothetical protein CPB84DRAFT_1775029 [Gymnopilus junonius]|uniref:Uncharacterized protein n=1 Tax=Gymnopilus junonius TaxID=109634 RepID=A0A9P5NSQ5_GYMJU|nr:hypothetical protein CPB84DRAFT_1775029 [Gymnopilus junonius]
MGGGAFSALLSASAFPRLPRPVYNSLKARVLSRLTGCYTWVGVPHEAPEKKDHGDVDFLVSDPKHPYTSSVPHDVIKKLIGAEYVIPMEGNRTSNYAIPVHPGEWAHFGLSALEEEKRAASEEGKIYYQVDVHVCSDKEEWDRIVFFHSYGDLGMILGLIARNSGLALGSKGLKLPDPPNPPFELSSSFDEICQFFGLPLSTFHKGFSTKREVFQWAASMKYFDPQRFRSSGPGITKVKTDRIMYAEFMDWVHKNKRVLAGNPDPRKQNFAKIREEALIFFKKKEEYDNIVQERLKRARLKEIFSGSQVRDWAQLGNYWKGVKLIMDEVRQRLGGEEGIHKFLEDHSEGDLKAVVLQAQADLGVISHQQSESVIAVTDSVQTMSLFVDTPQKGLEASSTP